MITPNTIVGNRYRVSRLLGGGGMKMVYLAEDLRLAARPCALAEMVDAISSPDVQRQAVTGFQREADMLAELSHEHIPRIYDCFSEQNRHYLVMEYVAGDTLEEEIKAAGGKLPEDRVIDIALQVLETLEYLHHREPPVIYRDLKPSNIMITPKGQVKLIDFGIARHFQPLIGATMVGTQGYAPPEQYRGKVETRSDLYALGATMHHALSGRDPTTEPPFSFPLLRKLCPQLNPALADLVSDALMYDVERRIRDVDEMEHRLLAIKNGPVTANGAQAAATGAQGQPQLQLPLKAPPPAPPPAAAPSTPTLLTVTNEIPCPACTRSIPGDSRFCSYCAADLRTLMAPYQVSDDPNAQTITLTQPSAPHHRTAGAPPIARRPRGRRSPLVTVVVVAVLAYVVVRLLFFLSSVVSAVGSRDAEPPAPAVHSGDTGSGDTGSGDSDTAGDAADPIRSTLLRQMLDAQGYGAVRFRLSGSSISLWGKVSSDADRETIEEEASTITGAMNLEDHLQVEE
ncbi:MAG TPA: serine/threonine-protein kinase [Candidatus Binataceae bacterium]|jgi:serine/threonine protein kinase|nr:serine/threonine-protein kinase [Candidatus Binataceae bacterium]